MPGAALGLRKSEHVLLQRALDDVDGAARYVVVVPARVVLRKPEDRPDVDDLVPMQRSEGAFGGRGVVVRLPELGPRGDTCRERSQLLGVEAVTLARGQRIDHAVTSCGAWGSKRPGLTEPTAFSAASL